MRVKAFQGRTLEEILPQIREELGDDAVVLSQKPLISGGVGGFFGKRVLEVVAADRMPTDAELIDIEGAQLEGESVEEAVAAATRSIDLIDDWDPALDEELSLEYGSISHGSRGGNAGLGPRIQDAVTSGYEPLQLPQRSATVTVDATSAPAAQAQALAEKAHRAIAAATAEIEQQLNIGPVVTHTQATVTPPAGTTGTRITAADLAAAQGAPTDDLLVSMTADAGDGGYLIAPAAEAARAPVTAAAPAPVPVHVPVQAAMPYAAVPTDPRPARRAQVLDHALLSQAQLLERRLYDRGVDLEVARAVMAKVLMHRRPFVGDVDLTTLTRDFVAENITTETGWVSAGRAHRMAVVGPSGAGKSSVIAKLAEGYMQQSGYRVVIVSIVGPNQMIGSLETGNSPLSRPNLDVRYVSGAEQMMMVVESLDDVDIIMVDTPGSAYYNDDSFDRVHRCLVAAQVDDVHVVVPLSTSVRETESILEHYRPVNVNRMVVSKLDESRYAGQLLNLGFRFSVPITFLSDGPRVPEDIRAASAREIASLIVPDEE